MKITKYICPNPKCGHEVVSKVENPSQCPECHIKFKNKRPKIINVVEI